MMKKTLHAQTGLRGVAALMVAIHHMDLTEYLPDLHRQIEWFIRIFARTDLFFMISGFILSYAYIKRLSSDRSISWLQFQRDRLFRIYPPYLASILGTLSITFLFTHPERIPCDQFKLPHVLSNGMLMHVFPWDGNYVQWNYPSWSLSVEFLCYLILGAVIAKRSKIA